MERKALLLKLSNILFRAKGIWLRALSCLIIGIAVLNISDNTKYDLRYQMRGEQSFDQNILLMYLNSNYLQSQDRFQSKNWYLKESKNKNSSYYWDKKYWKSLITALLDKGAKNIIINIRFDQNLIINDHDPIFSQKNVFWSSDDKKNIVDDFTENLNFFTSDFINDRDGKIRFYMNKIKKNTHIIEKAFPSKKIQNNNTINFRGHPGTFANQFIANKFDFTKKSIAGKTIIVGTDNLSSHILETPLGRMNSSEIIANVIDNHINERWISDFGFFWNCFYLTLILLLSVLILFSFPQGVALTYLTWLAAGLCALSLALFDTLNFWLPVLAPLLQIAFTYIFFLSYQLNVKNNKNWKLEEKQKLQFKSQQLKNNFISLFSHDLKTPIAKIQGICDRIISMNPENKFIDDIKLVKNETEQLNRYIQSILQITKVESKDFKIQKKPIDINIILEKVLSHLKFLLIENENTTELNLEPLFLIEADPVLIYEVFLNIIENSIKYAPKSNIKIKTYETEQFVHIIFKDNGRGIEEADLKYIFEKFYRAKNTSSIKKGSGLGLYLVKYFVQLHNGTISLSSQPGLGTEIHIKLPIDT